MFELFNRYLCMLPAAYGQNCELHWLSQAWISSEGAQIFGSTLLGAVVGALVAGGIQFTISRIEFRRRQELDAKAQHEREKAIALNIGIKAITLNNQLYSVTGLVVEMFEDADRVGLCHGEVFQKIVPVSGVSAEPIQFTLEEVALLFTMRESDLANNLLLLNEKIKSLTDTILRYSERRLEYGDISIEAHPARMQIRISELRDMANGICISLSEDFGYCTQIVQSIPPAFQQMLGESHFLTARVADGGASRLASLNSYLVRHGLLSAEQPS